PRPVVGIASDDDDPIREMGRMPCRVVVAYLADGSYRAGFQDNVSAPLYGPTPLQDLARGGSKALGYRRRGFVLRPQGDELFFGAQRTRHYLFLRYVIKRGLSFITARSPVAIPLT